MNTIKILFFATLRDYVGKREVMLDIDSGACVADLKTLLRSEFDNLSPALDVVLVAVNKEYASDDTVIPDRAEVAFFPPVSGGSGHEPGTVFPTIFSITEAEIDLDDLVAKITLPSTGAACVFTGMVRAETQKGDFHETAYLEYEAYVPMAESKMQQVADEIREKWPTVEGIAIVQRIGRLYPGTPTVLIACSAGHRDTGVFDAARYGIDRLKQIVPIWKKEVGPDGDYWVEGEHRPEAGE